MINIRKRTAKMLEEDFKIEPQLTETLFDFGILDEKTCRDKLIQQDFQRITINRRITDARITLAEKYCVSYSTVEKVTTRIGKED